MKPKYKIKHKWYQYLFFKYKYKKYEKTNSIKIEEADRFRFIWFIPIALIILIGHIILGLINWAKELPTICKWSDKEEGDMRITIYTFEKENEDG